MVHTVAVTINAVGALDAQQRAAADVSELRSRTASIEQVLRTVE